MRYTFYILLIVSLSYCQTKQTDNTNEILGKGKVYYASDYMKNKDGRLDVEFTLSPQGILLSKIDYDTGSERKPSESRYKFSELNIIERIDQYGDDIHYSSEYFDEIGNLVKYIPANLRDTREELHIDYDYDTNKYPLVESRSKLFFYRDSLRRSETTKYLFNYNDNYTLRTCEVSNDTSLYHKEYTFDIHKNILKECAYEKYSNSTNIFKYQYDNKNRMILKAKGNFKNCDDKLMSATNSWEYKYNDKNLVTELKLYTSGELQYTIVYDYSNLEKLKVNCIPKEMIKFMLKN